MANLQLTQQQISDFNTIVSSVSDLQTDVTKINDAYQGGAPLDPTLPGQSDQVLANQQYVTQLIATAYGGYVQASADMQDAFQTYQAFVQGPWYVNGAIVDATNTLKNNDYQFVTQDETKLDLDGVAHTTRYRYDGATSAWQFQLIVNNTPFTSGQLQQMNSGITSVIVTNINNNFSTTPQVNAINSGITQTLRANIPNSQSQLDQFNSGVTAALIQQREAKAVIIKYYQNDSTHFTCVLDKTKTGVTANSFACWDIETGDPITITGISGSDKTYTLEVADSTRIGTRFINA